jgi:hypothetical protein
VPVILIGALISPAAVTPYSIADRILTLFASGFTAISGVLTPKSAKYAANIDHVQQQRLFISGGRACTTLASYITLGSIVFGFDVIRLWLGPQASLASTYLSALSIGMGAMFSQAITRSMLLGIAKYRLLNVITMAHAIVVSVAVTVAGLNSGVLAICIAISVTSAIAAMAHPAPVGAGVEDVSEIIVATTTPFGSLASRPKSSVVKVRPMPIMITNRAMGSPVSIRGLCSTSSSLVKHGQALPAERPSAIPGRLRKGGVDAGFDEGLSPVGCGRKDIHSPTPDAPLPAEWSLSAN